MPLVVDQCCPVSFDGLVVEAGCVRMDYCTGRREYVPDGGMD